MPETPSLIERLGDTFKEAKEAITELLGPLSKASSELGEQGFVLDEFAQAAFDRARVSCNNIDASMSALPALLDEIETLRAQVAALPPVVEEGVTQADRETAADLEYLVGDTGYSHALRSRHFGSGPPGNADTDVRIQAFANHRQSSVAAALAYRGDEGVREALNEACFLLARVNDLDWCGTIDDLAREWSGHVDPPLCRLKAKLEALASQPDKP